MGLGKIPKCKFLKFVQNPILLFVVLKLAVVNLTFVIVAAASVVSSIGVGGICYITLKKFL